MAPTPASPATCVVLSPGEPFHGLQRLDYFAGISAQSAGAAGLCMHLVTIPPGARSEPHLHERHETAIYVLSGEGSMYWGEGLREHLTVRAGQFLFIPANVPHLTYNASETTPCTAVLARTDPNEQESVRPYAAPAPDPSPPRR
jgi:uncharacterized RmlC-like cupin family protein